MHFLRTPILAGMHFRFYYHSSHSSFSNSCIFCSAIVSIFHWKKRSLDSSLVCERRERRIDEFALLTISINKTNIQIKWMRLNWLADRPTDIQLTFFPYISFALHSCMCWARLWALYSWIHLNLNRNFIEAQLQRLYSTPLSFILFQFFVFPFSTRYSTTTHNHIIIWKIAIE